MSNKTNTPEVVEVVSTSNRPRPEVVELTKAVTYQSLDGSKWATLPYTMDGQTRVIDCKSITDPKQLIGFKVGKYLYKIPQYGVSLRITALYREVGEDGQSFKGAKTLMDGKVTTEDGKSESFTLQTGDKIRKMLGIEVEGTTKSPLGVAHRYFCKSEAKAYIEACDNKELSEAYTKFYGLLGLLRKEEAEKEAKAKAEKEAKAKAKAKAERADKSASDMSNEALLAELKKRGLI